MSSIGTPRRSPVAIATCGELFADGFCLEPLSGNRLALIGEQGTTEGATIEYNSSTYAASPLEPTLESALRIPSGSKPYRSTEYLFENLSELAQTRAGLDEVPAQLWATAMMATHLVNAIPVPPVNFCGAQSGQSAAAVQLTAALARRPLPVAELRFPELLKLPTGLCPTVLVSQPNPALLRYLLMASSTPGFVFLRSGYVVPFRCSLVTCSAQPASSAALSIALVPDRAPQHSPTPSELDSLAQQWQPMLLEFRARQWQLAAACTFDVPGFSAPVRQLARSFAATLAGSPHLQQQMVLHLQSVDESSRSLQGQGIVAAVTEALLALVLARAPHAYVHEVAELANQALTDRHEKPRLTAQAVGAILREHVGLCPKRMAAGYRLEFDAATSERIQWLAKELGIVEDLEPRSGDAALEDAPLEISSDAAGEDGLERNEGRV